MNKGHQVSLQGRLRVVEQFVKRKKFSLDIGSKNVCFGDVNLDIDRNCYPHVVADARWLPFKSGTFKRVFFTDAMEHLPRSHESMSLREIHRVLGCLGELILTTPHDISLFTLLDPAFYVMRHRHYKMSEVQSLLETNGFSVNSLFTSGGLWACINTLWYCCITYLLRRVLGFSLPYTPNKLRSLEDGEYKKVIKKGYTIFVKARKVS